MQAKLTNIRVWRVSSSGIWRRVVRCFNRRFGGTYRLHLQGLLATCLLAGLLNLYLPPWRWRRCSSETSVETTDYTASYPRRWYSSKKRCPVFGPRFEARTSRIWCKSATHLAITFCQPEWKRGVRTHNAMKILMPCENCILVITGAWRGVYCD
jgi:hypothetical protein